MIPKYELWCVRCGAELLPDETTTDEQGWEWVSRLRCRACGETVVDNKLHIRVLR